MRSYAEELIEQGRQQGFEQGLRQACAESVLRLLTVRGVHVGDEAQQRILACTDMATLDRWFDRALSATSLSDVLGDAAS
jgi:hypothetical protein